MKKIFWLFFALGAGLTFALGWFIQFHAVGNDFWNILYYGRNMTLAEPESLYNGFFPFGYAFLIGQLPFTYVLPLAYLLNALLSGLFTASVSTLIAYTRSFPATLIAFFCSIAAPFAFQNINTLGPDIGSLAFTSFAIFLLWRHVIARVETRSVENPKQSPDDKERPINWPFTRNMRLLRREDHPPRNDMNSILIGASLGLAFLWRTHTIVTAVAIFFGYFLLVGIRPIRPRVMMVSAFLSLLVLQVIINLWSGHGFLETAQAFNIYKFFYGVDMTNPPTPAEIAEFSVLDTILKDPALTFDLYIIPFKFLIFYAWPAAVCFVLSPKGKFAKYSLFSILFVLLYAIPVSLGDSARAPLMLMGVYASTIGLLLVILTDVIARAGGRDACSRDPARYMRWRAVPVSNLVVTILFIAAFAQTFYSWIRYDAEFIRSSRAERKSLTVIEQTMLSNGMTSPTEIFADRYDFYTPNTMPYRSRQIGNWSEDWVWGFSDEFPPLPNDSWESFAKACKEQGVRFLLLSPNSFYRADFFPKIYNGEVELETLGLKFIGQRGNIRIYKFE